MQKRRLAFIFLVLLFVVLPVVVAQDDVTAIAYGDRVEGEITNPSEADFYSFSGSEGDLITIDAESNLADVYIELYSADGEALAENDDISDNNLNAQIAYELPDDGDYFIAVWAYSDGQYTLSVDSKSASPSQGQAQQDDNNSTVSESDMAVIESGDTLTGEAIDLENPVIYTFSGEAGQTVTITASSDEVDTYLVLADANGDTIADNDDISSDNLNSQIEVVLPASGDYLIGVFGYSSGPFELSFELGKGGDTPTIPVSESGSDEAETVGGELDDDTYYLEYPVTVEHDGDTITIDAIATSGDLDTYLGLFEGDTVVAENDDREQGTTDSQLIYPNADAGEYVIAITRYGFEEGETSGEFEVSVKISTGSTSLVGTGGNDNVDPVSSGYPTLNPTDSIADWTLLVYMGGDNNLEDGLENDLDEFEIAGGSTESVRIVVLLDRAEGYSDANGDWTDTRVFEVGNEDTGDSNRVYPPTIDSRDLFNLGEIDTSYSSNLTDFLVWGIQNYPAQHYAVSINDHGGAWAGAVTDDTTGPGILSITDLANSFSTALKTTGIEKFDLLINDACLMSSIEYFVAVAPSFDYSISSPEITLNPSFDMTLLTEILNDNPSIDMGDLGKQMVDKYLADMTDLAPDTAPVLGAALTDLSKVGDMMTALDGFTSVVSENPDEFATMLGQVRSNTYAYSFFLPEDEYGPATNIDLGDFMRGVIDKTRSSELAGAAQDVIDALSAMRIYSNAGEHLGQWSSFYNIYFPQSGADFSSMYLQNTPLAAWTDMLRGFYNAVAPRTSRTAAAAGAVAAPSTVPQVNITNIFPTETSIAAPTKVSMEVIGRNVSQGIFTVDQIQADGTLIRLDSARIVTPVVEDGVADEINLWRPGIDDFTFTWEVTLNTVTDGTTSANELIALNDDVASLAGRYLPPGSEEWLEVTVIFDDEGRTSSVISRTEGSLALASIDLVVGGTFQTYRSVVTPDGRVQVDAGTIYTWPEGGITWHESAAPDGQYNLGFLIEALGGATGFDSATVTVDNEGIDPSLAGYTDMDWNFTFQRPADWTRVTYFPDEGDGAYEISNSPDGSQMLYVYPVTDDDLETITDGDLEDIAREVMGRYNVELNEDFEPATVGGRDALEFTFTYTSSGGDDFFGQAFAIYDPDLELGLVFSSEGLDEAETNNVYEILRDNLVFFDAQAIKDQDTGSWQYDLFTENDTYPVNRDWMPGADQGTFWIYRPGNASEGTTFAGITVEPDTDEDAATLLDVMLEQEIEGLPEYSVLSKETYYADNHTWEWASFTHEDEDGNLISGRLYVTVVDGRGYFLWFESPVETFDQTFRDVFTVMLDGFKSEEAD